MSNEKADAPFAYHGLDRVFHEKARLGIVSSLVTQAKGLAFSELKALVGLTDGNLSRHLQVLEEAGFIAIQKGFEGKRPVTHCTLTALGRNQFLDYLDVLEEVLRTASVAREVTPDSIP
ncbi:transcriptional regulator [Halioxenophilus sp. WMMB6]|uniref:winged helix-turn-helix domain-containing protein n=1 Tax=Halioxenophilus sp. WMMB6 TaxID=3073815 RepID=UPI00295E6A55|nr:transcriptional regulator [Halioxenophilus sp. WMMB6]